MHYILIKIHFKRFEKNTVVFEWHIFECPRFVYLKTIRTLAGNIAAMRGCYCMGMSY